MAQVNEVGKFVNEWLEALNFVFIDGDKPFRFLFHTIFLSDHIIIQLQFFFCSQKREKNEGSVSMEMNPPILKP